MKYAEDKAIRQHCAMPGCRTQVRIAANTKDEAIRLAELVLQNHVCQKGPPGWPPLPGDLWRARDYGLVAIRANQLAIPLENTMDSYELDELLDKQPELVYRWKGSDEQGA